MPAVGATEEVALGADGGAHEHGATGSDATASDTVAPRNTPDAATRAQSRWDKIRFSQRYYERRFECSDEEDGLGGGGGDGTPLWQEGVALGGQLPLGADPTLDELRTLHSKLEWDFVIVTSSLRCTPDEYKDRMLGLLARLRRHDMVVGRVPPTEESRERVVLLVRLTKAAQRREWARPALPRSWAYLQAPSQTRMSHSAC